MKKTALKFRRLLAVGIAFASLLFLLFIFFVTRSLLEVWEYISNLPAIFYYAYLGMIMAVIATSAWVIIKILSPRAEKKKQEKIDQETVLKELDAAKESGMDTAELHQEIAQLQERKESGSIYVAIFGDVSTGKSSIIKTLLPSADVLTDVRGGSTAEINEYTWTSTSGDQLILTDLPGRSEAEGNLDEMAHDEAVRAQVVIYVTDSDLTRSQFNDILMLRSYGKPMIVALNKSDRFTDEEQALLKERFNQQFEAEEPNQMLVQDATEKSLNKNIQLTFIKSGGTEEVVRIYPDGHEEKVLRPRKADVSALSYALQEEIDAQSGLLESLRDASVFVLVKQKLDNDIIEFRRDKASEVITSSTRKAVLGALASISPGTDLLIQGVLATLMVKKLCELYEVPMRKLDIEKFLNFSQGQVKKSVPILLAVAGNGMKAFPGIGTVTGGLTHAVAYGMIFDALGKATAKTLEERGQLRAAPAAITFKEMLSENMEARARLFAKLVFDNRKK
ncbi:MAG: 50S ribosome-binding GTPase [Cocleimonas sp.]|nr:50S ribosome-binding GTPase [Cocleimonas sp.]